MGFFSSIGGLFGGSKSTSSSGYGALPKVAQQAMDEVTKQGRALLLGPQGANVFTPLPQTAQETQAFGLAQLPTTAEGIKGLVGNYLNPFQDYITQGINKQAEGGYSAYKSALANAGQMGSNREFLNASAADEARLNAIGNAMAGNYNTAQQTALGQNQQNILNLLSQGSFQRDLAAGGNEAQLKALQAMAQLLGVYPNTQTQTTKDYGKGLLGTAASFAAGGMGG